MSNVLILGELAEFADFLHQQRLHTLWLDLLDHPGRTGEHKELAARLAGFARASVARELPQQRALSSAHKIFENNDIPYFIAKGVHLRHVHYRARSLRPAVDIDLFVKETDRMHAIQALRTDGFRLQPRVETVSHEIKITRQHADIDLHSCLFRPGRARSGLMDWLFEHRERFGEFWGLDATASLLVMLVHPAITKYLLSPASMLIHQVDQMRLINCGKVDWDELEAALTRYGLKTSAWSSLYVLRILGGAEAPGGLEERLRPGRVHHWYLRQWIDRGWISKWFDRRWLVAGLFSLALQDSAADAWRAMRKLSEAKREAGRLMQELPSGGDT